jgi:predicted nucleotidyltransferase
MQEQDLIKNDEGQAALSRIFSPRQQGWLQDRTILLVNHGSVAYGTSTPESDVDIKGVVVPPVQYFHGFLNKFEQAESKDPDLVIYDIRKFCYLASECNPNIIEVLWVDPSDYRLITPLGQKLIDARELFISKKARHTFSGYAVAQLKRIQTHYRWLKSPPDHEPTREEFGLIGQKLIPVDQLEAAQSMINKTLEAWRLDDLDDLDPSQKIAIQAAMSSRLSEILKWTWDEEKGWSAAARSLGFSDNFIYLLGQEKKYKTKQIEWSQYQNWLKTRNPKRAAIEAKYGYDCKHAMHLVRLMRMCREILETGKVIVKRPDREELLAIRNGLWTYEQLLDWSIGEDVKLDQVYQTSTLRHSPDRKALDKLCQSIVEEMLKPVRYDSGVCSPCCGD